NKKPIKPVRFVSIIDENSLTPTLPRPSSLQPTLISSSSIMQIDNKTNQDTLWDFMKESNSELFEKREKIYNDKKKHVDRFSIPQPTSSNKTNTKITKSIPISDTEFLCQREFLHVLLPYHKFLCQENIWPKEHSFTLPNISLQLIKDICEDEKYVTKNSNRSDILKYLMFIYTITSFLYIFAYCSLQTAIRHVENIIVQNMKNVCIDQECGKPLFDLLTKTHQKFENILHPKILHIKQMFVDFFDKRRRLMGTIRQVSEPKFLLLVQYESIELLHDIERGLSSIIELRSYVYDKQANITRDEFNDLLMYNNMIIIRTRQISSTIITRPKRLTLIIEYECGEQIPQWYRFCQQQFISYLAYKTILPSFIPPS
ncbi:unnamed protein product, partial [Rotaria sp. Silwood2]